MPAPEVTTGDHDPTADVSDTGAGTTDTPDTTDTPGTTDTPDTTDASTGTTDASTDGDIPLLDCPEVTPAPADCGRLPETCGNATPIAGERAGPLRR